MVKRLAPYMSEPRRTLLRAADGLGPAITRMMTARPHTEALVRTTTAPTVIRGGVKANVLPQHAHALINFRILHGDSVASVLEHCQRIVDDDDVAISISGMRSEPSPISPSEGATFDLISSIVREMLPDVAITTGIVPGATDSRHYNDVVDTRYNFAPVVFTQADLDRIHGTDERISRANYARIIEFNRRLIEKL
jgi:carboxypeptidase PM20D1